jgi:hypothetical protein
MMHNAADPQDSSQVAPLRVQYIVRQLIRLLSLSVLIAVLGIVIAAGSAFFQAQHSELQRADILIAVVPQIPRQSLIDQALAALRQYPDMTAVLIGSGSTNMRTALLDQGLPVERIVVYHSEQIVRQSLRLAVSEQQRQGAQSALVLAAPPDLLLALKVVRDGRLQAYGVPTPQDTGGALDFVRGGVDYWAYVLAGGE